VLTHRCLRHEGLESRDEISRLADAECRLPPRLDRGRPELAQLSPARFGRCPVPQLIERKLRAELQHSVPLGRADAPFSITHRPLEPFDVGVDLIAEPVAVGDGLDHIRTELPAHPQNVVLHRLPSRHRRDVRPQRLDQRLDGHRGGPAHGKSGEKCALHRPKADVRLPHRDRRVRLQHPHQHRGGPYQSRT
jgi:hypothetical protein